MIPSTSLAAFSTAGGSAAGARAAATPVTVSLPPGRVAAATRTPQGAAGSGTADRAPTHGTQAGGAADRPLRRGGRLDILA